MADSYVNATGVQAIKTWVDSKYNTLDAEVTTLSERVDDIVAEGGEPNVIETVKVNGTALTPDASKAVDITVPTQGTSENPSGYATYQQYDSVQAVIPSDATSTNQLATEDYVSTNGGKIDKIKVNGTEQTITNKEVDITVPTVGSSSNVNGYIPYSTFISEVTELENSIPVNVSELQNDAGYQTESDVRDEITNVLSDGGGDNPYTKMSDVTSAIGTAVASAYKYKGTVATVDALPSSDQTVGDVYDVQSTGMNYAWNGTTWDALGQYVDTSVFWTSTEGQSNTLVAMTVAEINAILEPSA